MIIKSWQVFFCLLLCYMFYEYEMRLRDVDYGKLSPVYQRLQEQKNQALVSQQDLLVQINSQSDPDWVELTLVKGLNLVAEDQTKVYFASPEDPSFKSCAQPN
jgi:hypothetical protein